MTYGRTIANADIRRELKQARIPFWLIGRQIGVTELTVSRWLREPLPEDKRQVIVEAIRQIKAEDAGGGANENS